MGVGVEKKCTKCGFEFTTYTGVGMMFPYVYQETTEKARRGDLGDEMKQFFMEHPDGAIDAENVTLCCDDCGHLSCGQDLTMFIPGEKTHDLPARGPWCIADPQEDMSYFTRRELDRFFSFYASYHHKCEKCGGRMHVVSSNELEELKCPQCKVKMIRYGVIDWD